MTALAATALPFSAPFLNMAGVVVQANNRAILDVATFTVAAGESVALIGPNGAGKTTLLHVAALLRQPDRGTVIIDGQMATADSAACLRRKLAVVFQDPLLFDTTAIENAAAGLRFASVPRAEAERRAGEWLARFGVAHLSRRRARSLSGGEAGRVALARAFATAPALLLLDEPFAALDAPTRTALLPELRAQVRETSASAVLVTHDLDEAFAFGDRLAILSRGQIVAMGRPAELVACPPSREAANLLGVENVHSAIVREVSGGFAGIALLPDGPVLQAAAALEHSLTPGQQVTMTTPAMAVQILDPGTPSQPGWNVLHGRVSAVTPHRMGARAVVETPAPIAAFIPWQAHGCGRRVGEYVAVAFPPDAVHIIGEAE